MIVCAHNAIFCLLGVCSGNFLRIRQKNIKKDTKFCNFTFYYYLCVRKKETPQAHLPMEGNFGKKVLGGF